MEQLNKLLLAEEEAKLGVLYAMAAGENIVMLGDPGGGKTTLAENSHRLIDGVSREQVASIPVDAELSPKEVIGGEVRTTKKIGDEEVEEKFTMDSLIRPDTRIIFADEINRTAPFAVNATLGAVENGSFDTTQGRVTLNGLISAFSTMNPAEDRQSVFPVSGATASRYSVGVVLGEDEPGKETEVIDDIFHGWDPKPEEVESIVDLEGLRAIRNRIRSRESIAFPENLIQDVATPAVLKAVECLRGEGVRETSRRMSRQTRDTSKAIAALYGQEAVTEENIRTAVRFFVTARVGMLVTRSAVETSKQVTSEIFA
jgi:MoxR-like ATPase